MPPTTIQQSVSDACFSTSLMAIRRTLSAPDGATTVAAAAGTGAGAAWAWSLDIASGE